MSKHDDVLSAPRVDAEHIGSTRALQPPAAPEEVEVLAAADTGPAQPGIMTSIAVAIGYTALGLVGIVLGLILGLVFVEATGLAHFTIC